jgi:hypothetical protein
MTGLYDTPKIGRQPGKACCAHEDADLKVSEERVHEEVQNDEGCKDGIQNSHEDKSSFKPVVGKANYIR